MNELSVNFYVKQTIDKRELHFKTIYNDDFRDAIRINCYYLKKDNTHIAHPIWSNEQACTLSIYELSKIHDLDYKMVNSIARIIFDDGYSYTNYFNLIEILESIKKAYLKITFSDLYVKLDSEAKLIYPNSELIKDADVLYNMRHLSVCEIFKPMEKIQDDINSLDDGENATWFKWNDIVDKKYIELITQDMKQYYLDCKDMEV